MKRTDILIHLFINTGMLLVKKVTLTRDTSGTKLCNLYGNFFYCPDEVFRD